MNVAPAVNFLLQHQDIRTQKRLGTLLGVSQNYFSRLSVGITKGLRPEFRARVLDVVARYSGEAEYEKEAGRVLATLSVPRVLQFVEVSKKLDGDFNSLNQPIPAPSLSDLKSS
ncbi:hypothetical protein M2128_001339 [Polynucleobacter sphagniphilus]|uniref:hypothetical protein n=1 Tax=Polynucleobacter sphagniphilus TaxID=1743169 RepID=UPI0024743632|nr:hypothetical protein [Polynucleobacter sphagniphilus]MDH6302418.1 hypothetical protein [Polynucleobacter sphagniphilus]